MLKCPYHPKQSTDSVQVSAAIRHSASTDSIPINAINFPKAFLTETEQFLNLYTQLSMKQEVGKYPRRGTEMERGSEDI